jgi:hypothetical protein
VINPKLHKYVDRLSPTAHYRVSEFVDNCGEGVLRRRDLLERAPHLRRVTRSPPA